MIPQVRKYNIPIYVSDNASTDDTLRIIESFKKDYPFLYFKRNSENLGVDRNMINAALMASAKYVWVFGSRRILLPGMLSKIYNILNESDFDLIVLNDLNSTFIVPESQKYSSAENVFRQLYRNLTGLGFQILPLDAWRLESVIQKYAGTEWTVFGLALEFIASKQNPHVYFVSEPCATSSGDSHWKSKYFQIWADYKKVVYSLPETYSDDDKEFVIRNSVNFLLFTSRFRLLELRSRNFYNVNIFRANRKDLILYGKFSPNIAYSISRLPVTPLKLYYKFYDAIRTIMRKFIHAKVPLNPTRR